MMKVPEIYGWSIRKDLYAQIFNLNICYSQKILLVYLIKLSSQVER